MLGSMAVGIDILGYMFEIVYYGIRLILLNP